MSQQLSLQNSSQICIVGAGFAGSLLAWILARGGKQVILVDRSSHPRFTLGESSTPLADFYLELIADRFSLPEIKPLSRWGTWQSSYPELRAGKKRGFSYYKHSPSKPFSEGAEHEASLLVAASASDQLSDTHWMRSDLDHWLCVRAAEAGVQVFEQVSDMHASRWDAEGTTSGGWLLKGEKNGEPFRVQCEFLVDASGSGGLLGRACGLDDLSHRLRTQNGALYGHFRGVGSMTQWLSSYGVSCLDDPFNGDDAAQHHWIEDGWMWMLRFLDGTTSVGIVRPTEHFLAEESTDDAWSNWVSIVERYPTLAALLEHAELIAPRNAADSPRLGWLPRIGRLWGSAAGENWAMLPGTVGVVDPLHSTGIAHGLSGVVRLADALLFTSAGTRRAERLKLYSSDVVKEVQWIDQIVSICYQAAAIDFSLFTTVSSLYFVAAIEAERQVAEIGTMPEGFLLKDVATLHGIVSETELRLVELAKSSSESLPAEMVTFNEWFRTSLSPWNKVGLMDPALRNRISRSVAPKI